MKKEVETVRRYIIDDNWYVETIMNYINPAYTDVWLGYRKIAVKQLMAIKKIEPDEIEIFIIQNISKYVDTFKSSYKKEKFEPLQYDN